MRGPELKSTVVIHHRFASHAVLRRAAPTLASHTSHAGTSPESAMRTHAVTSTNTSNYQLAVSPNINLQPTLYTLLTLDLL